VKVGRREMKVEVERREKEVRKSKAVEGFHTACQLLKGSIVVEGEWREGER